MICLCAGRWMRRLYITKLCRHTANARSGDIYRFIRASCFARARALSNRLRRSRRIWILFALTSYLAQQCPGRGVKDEDFFCLLICISRFFSAELHTTQSLSTQSIYARPKRGHRQIILVDAKS